MPESKIKGIKIMSKRFSSILISVLVLFAPLNHAEIESWYTYWGIGASDNSYGEELDATLDAAEENPNVDRTELSIDALGIYFPIQDGKTLIGGVISGSADRIDNDATGAQLQINRYLYAVSAMHFMGNEAGDGFFVRGDAGIAKLVMDSNITDTVSSESGTGILLGVGYGFPISSESRLIVGANYSVSKIEDVNVSSMMFTIGGLW